jgi:hypothetical protein
MASDDRVYLLPKDPCWTFVGWDLAAPPDGQLVLRVANLTDGGGFDVEVTGDTDHWYLRLPVGGRAWQVRLASRSASGELRPIAESNPLRLPPDGPSGRSDESWSTVPIRRRRWTSKAIS